MITKELLLREIDRLDAGYREVLYKIIKAFESPIKAHGGIIRMAEIYQRNVWLSGG